MRSTFEERVAADLKKRGIAYEYEPYSLAYVMPRKYTPDFKIARKLWVLEVKGWFTAGDRSKTLAVLSQHPGLDLRFCFQNAQNKIVKGSKTTYAMWCDKNGIPWCQGTIPKSWLE